MAPFGFSFMVDGLGTDYFLPLIGLGALACYLVLFAVWLVICWKDRPLAWMLGAFFLLVGVGNGMDALGQSMQGTAAQAALRHTSRLMAIVDGVFLVGACAWAAGWRGRAFRRVLGSAAMLSGGVAVAFVALGSPGFQVNTPAAAAWHHFGYAFGGLYLILIGLSLALLLTAMRKAEPESEREVHVVLLGVGVLGISRLALLESDLLRLDMEWRIAMRAGVVLVGWAVVAWALTHRRGTTIGRRTAQQSGALLGLILAIWVLALVPLLTDAMRSVAYSSRWYIVPPVLVIASRGEGLLGRNVRGHRAIASAAFALLAANAVLVFGGAIGARTEAPLAASLFTTAAIAGLAALGMLAWKHATRHDILAAADPRSMFRLYVLSGADASSLERLRTDLGLSRRHASRIRRIAAIEAGLRSGAPAPMDGTRYVIQEVLAAGSTGVVYGAWDRRCSRRVAIKEYRASSDRLERELDALLRIHHPNVVSAVDVAAGPNGPWLVMERVEGRSLRDRLLEGPLGAEEGRALARDLASACRVLHDAGIVHGDIKPENIVFDQAGRAVLVDLGSVHPPHHPTLTVERTPGYAPPQALGRAPTPADDVYAIGVCLQESLQGGPEGTPEGLCSLIDRCIQGGAGIQDGQSLVAALKGLQARRFPSLGREVSARARTEASGA